VNGTVRRSLHRLASGEAKYELLGSPIGQLQHGIEIHRQHCGEVAWV
jgi:hypothetical protein